MKSQVILIAVLSLMVVSCQEQQPKYSADWESLSQVNPVPEWFKDAKFGIYFHWGVYSVPAYSNEWYPRNMYREGSGRTFTILKIMVILKSGLIIFL
jgi:hypothetical protein